jgi:aminoglycoside N3'-acetyltransferase
MNLKRDVWNWIKKKYRIRSKELFINKYKRKIERRIYKKKYDTSELMNVMNSMGLKKGTNVFIHSSWDEFYNYTGTVDDFIEAILAEIGASGTLAMPAYPLLRKPESIFDIEKTPTGAGLIAETFRKYPGVKRSINMHSVCALGPMSDFLLNEHQYSVTSWDENSPYYKLSKINAKIFAFGLGRYFVGTTMHCADSVLREEVPYFSQFFQKQATYRYRLSDQSIIDRVCLTYSDDFRYYFTNRSHHRVISRYFDKKQYRKTKLSNLTINMYNAEYFINRIIELGRQGVTVYLKPDPNIFYNRKRRIS